MESVEKLLTPEELADKLNVKLTHLYGLVRKDEIPYCKVGKLLRFKESEIEEWLKK